jgi:hypothetical protein
MAHSEIVQTLTSGVEDGEEADLGSERLPCSHTLPAFALALHGDQLASVWRLFSVHFHRA